MSADIVTSGPALEITPKMREQMKMLKATLDEADRERAANCKIAKHMREQGFDPNAGFVLFLTAATAAAAGVKVEALPYYCRISYVLDSPKVAFNPSESEIQALCGKPAQSGG